jgi:hypothetical protein
MTGTVADRDTRRRAAFLLISKRSLKADKEQLQEAPVDPEMLARIDAARAYPSAGIPHEEVSRTRSGCKLVR